MNCQRESRHGTVDVANASSKIEKRDKGCVVLLRIFAFKDYPLSHFCDEHLKKLQIANIFSYTVKMKSKF
jgi:hypothetical protein